MALVNIQEILGLLHHDANTDFSDYARLTTNWEYGEEAYGEKNTSFTIGNMFLLTGPATDIEENKRWYQPIFESWFQSTKAAMSLSSSLLGGDDWRDVHIKNRTKNSLNSSKKDSPIAFAA